MSVALVNSLSSPFVPTRRAIYQIDGSDTDLVTYLNANTTTYTTGGYSVDRSSGSPVLNWSRYHHAPDVSGLGLVWTLGPDGGTLALPAAGQYVIASNSDLPPVPAVFDPTGWWSCDDTGHPLNAAVLQSTQKVSTTKVAVGRNTITSGTYTTGATFDLSITFDAAAAASPNSGWVQIQPGAAWLGKTRAVVKDGSITTTGCTVTVTVLANVTPSSSQPITYEAVCLYTYLADP